MAESERPTSVKPSPEETGALSARTEKVLRGVATASAIFFVWIPAAMAMLALLIGIFTLSVEYLAFAVIIGILAFLMWCITVGADETRRRK